MSSILRITDPIPSDDSIDKYEDIEYEPVAGTNLNSSGADIRLTIETQDIFTHPSESFLIIEGELRKNDNNRYGDNDPISLTNNGMMHLFKRIRYDLSGQEIESLLHPGQATTMLRLLKYPDDFSKSKGLNQLWYKDTTNTAVLADNVGFKIRHDYIINNSRPRGSFSFRIPLKHIFGFCGDYDKVVYGLKHNLTFMESLDCLICTKFILLCQNRNISSQVFNILSCSIFTWCASIHYVWQTVIILIPRDNILCR